MRMLTAMVISAALIFGCGDESGGDSGDTCGLDKGCASGLLCDYPRDGCGDFFDRLGTCVALPEDCEDTAVCGCDGTVYEDGCAQRSGVDIDANAANCNAPEDLFACGSGYCRTDFDYCENVIMDFCEILPCGSNTCLPFPASCGGTPSCDCLADEMCGEMCFGGDYFVVTCLLFL